MNSVVIKAEDAYIKFLTGIRYQHTSQVEQDMFNMYWNDAALVWTKGKLLMPEFTQKYIDDLANLRIVTDGVSTIYASIPTSGNNTFRLPKFYVGINANNILYDTINGVNYPLYLHGLVPIFNDSVGAFGAYIKRSDQKVISMNNPYRMATTDRPLYEHIGDNVVLYGRNALSMSLDYYRYPKLMTYDENGSSIDPEFNPSQNTEITDIAIRMFLENRTNPRYKSFLNDMMVKSQGR